MQKAILIAEKPDLMRKIKDVYDKHRSEIPYEITFTAQRGHLVALKTPTEMDEDLRRYTWETLPIVPEMMGGWQYKLIEEKKQGNLLTSKERYKEIEKELRSGKYDFIIHAGDPDQEGELLVRLVLSYAGTRLPVKRFWTNDLTDSHVLKALTALKDDDHDPMLTNLLAAAYARQHSDWRYGMNISRASSLKMNSVVSCGRVKTPILAIVCRREEEIRNFKPKTVYGVKAVYEDDFTGTLFEQRNGASAESDDEDAKAGIVWYDTRKEAEEVIRALGKEAVIVEYEAKKTETLPPKLYKLATLQIDAGKKGYQDAEATLAAVQRLYEQEYVSYPRTSCEYLSSNEDFYGILGGLAKLDGVSSFVKTISRKQIEKTRHTAKWINDKALEEEGHSALRPTTKIPDLEALPKMDRDIYLMIVKRFVAIFLPPLVQNKTLIIAKNNGKTFRSTGKTLVSPGYTEIFDQTFSDSDLPPHKKGDILPVKEHQVAEKTSTCPSRYTMPELINACENPLKYLDDESLKRLGKQLKIGTPATRSGIIRQLIDKNKYMEIRKEKRTEMIHPTPNGEKIIRNLKGLEICRVDMTGIWEEKLEEVRTGKRSAEELEAEMRANVAHMITEIKGKDMEPLESKKSGYKEVGTCPACGKPLLESEKGYFCSGYKAGCKLAVYKTVGQISFSADDFISLINKEKVTKEGRTFYYDFENARLAEEGRMTDLPCPKCKKPLSESDDRYFCGCGFTIRKTTSGHVVTKEDLISLGCKKETDYHEDFVSKSGEPFKAKIIFDKDGKLGFGFEHKPSEFSCPCCKKKKLDEYETNYKCGCGFTIWKTVAKRPLSKSEIADLCEKGETEELTGFYSSAKRKEFSCSLKVNKRKKAVEMVFSKTPR